MAVVKNTKVKDSVSKAGGTVLECSTERVDGDGVKVTEGDDFLSPIDGGDRKQGSDRLTAVSNGHNTRDRVIFHSSLYPP